MLRYLATIGQPMCFTSESSCGVARANLNSTSPTSQDLLSSSKHAQKSHLSQQGKQVAPTKLCYQNLNSFWLLMYLQRARRYQPHFFPYPVKFVRPPSTTPAMYTLNSEMQLRRSRTCSSITGQDLTFSTSVTSLIRSLNGRRLLTQYIKQWLTMLTRWCENGNGMEI